MAFSIGGNDLVVGSRNDRGRAIIINWSPQDRMGSAFLNSLIVTIPSTVIPITIAAFAAYAFAWIPFPGRGLLFIIVVALLVVPL